MTKKSKGQNQKRDGEFVFSTNRDFVFDSDEDENDHAVGHQNLEAHLEKKGRAGKTAVIIKGFIGSVLELSSLSKELKLHCGTGGTVKDGDVILQGDCRIKAMEFLNKKGYSVKRVGG